MTGERRWRVVLGLIVAAVLALVIGIKAGHAAGLRAVAIGIVAIVAVLARTSIAAEKDLPASRPNTDPNADFPRYRHFVSALRFADNRRFDFDRATRPPLVRLYSRVLAEEHGVRIVSDRASAQALVGPLAWSLIEVMHGARTDAAAVSRKELEDVVSRLEELSS